MKKHLLKNLAGRRAVAFLLVAGMLLPITACKKKDKSGDPDQPQGNKRQEYVLETDPYFSASEQQFDLPYDEERAVEGINTNGCRFIGDKIYVSYSIDYKLTQEIRDEQDKLNLWDTEDLLRYFEIQDSMNQTCMISYTLDGKISSTFEIRPGEHVASFFGTKEGKVGAFISTTRYEVKEDTNEVEQNWVEFLVYFSEDGKRLEEYELERSDAELTGKVYFELDNGNFLMLNNMEVLLMDPKGKILSRENYADSCESLFSEDGKYYMLISSEHIENEKVTVLKKVQEIDPSTGKLGAEKDVDPTLPAVVYECGGSLYSADEMEPIRKVDILKGTSEVLVDYNNTDIRPINRAADIRVEDNGDIYVLSKKDIEGMASWVPSVPALVHIHKEEKNPYAGRRIVYAASCASSVGPAFEEAINEYNKRPESKARVVTYTPETDVAGYGKALAAISDTILLDMKSGNGPDVLLNCADFSHFNADGILLDLNTYIDGSDGIDRSKYYDNIFRAFEVNGKLYQLPLSVSVEGFLGNPDILGDISGWTVSEFREKMAGLGDSIYPLIGHSWFLGQYWSDMSTYDSTGMLVEMVCHDLSHYVDYSGHTANFDTDDFRAILETAKQNGGRLTGDKLSDLYERYDDMSDQSPYSRMMEDKVCSLAVLEFSDLERFASTSSVCSGNPLYLGWPTSGESGLSAVANQSVGISAYSQCPDEAWDFIAYLLSENVQSDKLSGVVVLREGLGKIAHADLAKYLEKVEFYADMPGMLSMDAVLSEEALKKYEEQIEKIHTSLHVDLQIADILIEEAPAFFNGQKSAEEVSKIIQDRASILLAETK